MILRQLADGRLLEATVGWRNIAITHNCRISSSLSKSSAGRKQSTWACSRQLVQVTPIDLSATQVSEMGVIRQDERKAFVNTGRLISTNPTSEDGLISGMTDNSGVDGDKRVN